MAGNGKKNCDFALAFALASGLGVSAAARKAEISVRTARRRLRDPTFRAQVDRLRCELVQRAAGRLAALGGLAVAELKRLIRDGKSDAVKLGSVRATLDFMLRTQEFDAIYRAVQDLKHSLEPQPLESPPEPPRPPKNEGQP